MTTVDRELEFSLGEKALHRAVANHGFDFRGLLHERISEA